MKKLPVGIQSFKDLRQNDYLYIDKTNYIYQLINSGKVYFLSRPRRFGKSLLINTIEALFKGNKQIVKVQTDNGLEFYKHFEGYLKREKIRHYWNYPRSPKSNAYIERFNRTLREQFFNSYEGDLIDIEGVEEELKDYLFWYIIAKRFTKG